MIAAVIEWFFARFFVCLKLDSIGKKCLWRENVVISIVPDSKFTCFVYPRRYFHTASESLFNLSNEFLVIFRRLLSMKNRRSTSSCKFLRNGKLKKMISLENWRWKSVAGECHHLPAHSKLLNIYMLTVDNFLERKLHILIF